MAEDDATTDAGDGIDEAVEASNDLHDKLTGQLADEVDTTVDDAPGLTESDFLGDDDQETDDVEDDGDGDEGDADSSSDDKAWDKQRQEAQQEAANLRKEMAAQKVELEALRKTTADDDDEDSKALSSAKAGPFDGDDEIAKLEGELASLAIEPLDELADEDDSRNLTNALIADREKRQRLDVLRGQRDQAAQERANHARSVDALDTCIDGKLNEAGLSAKYRNQLVKRCRATWKERGYDETRYPDPEMTEDIVEVLAFKLARKLIASGELKKSATKKKSPAADVGKSGPRKAKATKKKAMTTAPFGTTIRDTVMASLRGGK